MKLISLFSISSLSLIFYAQAIEAATHLAPEQRTQLIQENNLIKAKVRELDDISKDLIAAKTKSDATLDSIDHLQEESDQAAQRLAALQKIDRESPDTIAPEKLTEAKNRNRDALSALNDAKNKSDEYLSQVSILNAKASGKYSEFLVLEKSFERDVDTIVNAQVDQQIQSMQTTREVTVTSRTTCGDETIKQCRDRSTKAAEVAASEQGSVVFVSSLTEVRNFNLSKDEIRSEVQATLSNKEIVKQQMFGEAEGYETTLKANVSPVIGDNLREQMSEGVRAEIYALAGGQVDYSQVRNPALGDDTAAVQTKSQKKAETDARARQEARRAARAEDERRRKEEAARAEEERRRQQEEARMEEERRQEEARQKAAREEEERQRSATPTINF